jgi:hypothetical protein
MRQPDDGEEDDAADDEREIEHEHRAHGGSLPVREDR